MRINYSILIILASGLLSCENRDVNSNDGPNFSEIHEDIHYHFDKVKLEGSEYFILERDRNNPHEGFGFMALKGNDLKANQDSIKAYLKTILDFQVKLAANLNRESEDNTSQYANELFQFYLKQSSSPFYIQDENPDIKKAED